MRLLKLLFCSFILCLAIVSCSRSSGGGSGKTIIESKLMEYLPESTLGFVAWDNESESYKNFIKTASANSTKALDLIKKVQEQGGEDLNKIMPILDGLVETGLVSKTASDKELIRTGLIFIEVEPGNTPGAGIYLAAESGTNVTDRITKLKDIIAKQGYTVSPETYTSGQGFSIEIEEAKASGFPISRIYIVSAGEKIALGTSTAIASRFMADAAPSPALGLQKIKESNEFKQATRSLKNADPMTFAFFDVNKLVKTVEQATGQPDEDLNSLPVESLAISSSMKGTMSNTLAVSLNPKNDLQKKVISSLAIGGKNDIVKKVPSDTMLALSFDGSTLVALKNAALEQAPPEFADQMKPMLDLVDSIKTLGVAVRGASGASPFPELAIVAESSKSADLKSMVKTQAEAGLASSGMPLPWLEKEIGGSKVSYAVSPFGVGMYLTNFSDLLVIGSSEKIISDVAASHKDNGQGLLASLPDTSKEMVNNSKPFLIAYTDFRKIGNAIGSAQDSLAMFTGGQTSITPEDLEAIKQIGSVMISVDVADNIAKLQSNYEVAGKKG